VEFYKNQENTKQGQQGTPLTPSNYQELEKQSKLENTTAEIEKQ